MYGYCHSYTSLSGEEDDGYKWHELFINQRRDRFLNGEGTIEDGERGSGTRRPSRRFLKSFAMQLERTHDGRTTQPHPRAVWERRNRGEPTRNLAQRLPGEGLRHTPGDS